MSQEIAEVAAHFARFFDRSRAVDRLARLVAIPSENPPGNEAAAADAVAAMCEDLGMSVELIAAEAGRPNVIARLGSGSPRVCYCSHIDVVPVGDRARWARDPFGAGIEGDRMYGRGACDAKGPIAAALEAVAILQAAGAELTGTLELALCADEEAMGFKGAGYLVAEGHLRPDAAIVGEPTSLRVVRAQRGASWFRVRTKGIAAHGSQPDRGVNAIMHMAALALELERHVPDVRHPLLGGPSINVGTISGGDKVNMVASWCEAEIDRRTVPGETREDVVASIQAAVDAVRERWPDISAEIDLAFYAPPFEVEESAPIVGATVAAMNAAAPGAGGIAGFRGASDARFLADAGTPVVVCGPGDITLAHTVDESIDLGEVAAASVGYALAFRGLLA